MYRYIYICIRILIYVYIYMLLVQGPPFSNSSTFLVDLCARLHPIRRISPGAWSLLVPLLVSEWDDLISLADLCPLAQCTSCTLQVALQVQSHRFPQFCTANDAWICLVWVTVLALTSAQSDLNKPVEPPAQGPDWRSFRQPNGVILQLAHVHSKTLSYE